ncbi:hypothetical protein [Halorientalis marina]|jgi:hypothetical protein|uniref:hypothetical protein n=1 Tax=Halorientalis marina TaxID=2931976 RepID=UPI001FF5C6BD|nr:hypothetical protein [Halorientalis marina]
MTPERKVLLGDGAVGLSVVLPGLLYFGSALVWWAPIPGALVAFTTAAVQHYAEHVGFESTVHEALFGLAGIVLPLAVAAALVLVGSPLGPPIAFVAFAGTGTGFLGYRFVFGVLRPVPEKRLERAGERVV